MAKEYKEFAELLNKHLQDQERGPSWLAEKIGPKSTSTISKWLNDKQRPGDFQTVGKIADAFNLDAVKRRQLFASAGYEPYWNVSLPEPDQKPQHEEIKRSPDSTADESTVNFEKRTLSQIAITEEQQSTQTATNIQTEPNETSIKTEPSDEPKKEVHRTISHQPSKVPTFFQLVALISILIVFVVAVWSWGRFSNSSGITLTAPPTTPTSILSTETPTSEFQVAVVLTPTVTATLTQIITSTATSSNTATPSPEPTQTETATIIPSSTATPTPLPSATATPIPPTQTLTPTSLPTATATSLPPTQTATSTATSSPSETPTLLPSDTPTTSPTFTPVAVDIATSTPSQLPTTVVCTGTVIRRGNESIIMFYMYPTSSAHYEQSIPTDAGVIVIEKSKGSYIRYRIEYKPDTWERPIFGWIDQENIMLSPSCPENLTK